MNIVKFIISFIISFFVTSLLVPVFIYLASRFKIVDTPDNNLKKHKIATPYLGGVAIFFGFLSSVLIYIPLNLGPSVYLLGCAILVFVGLIDDLFVLSPVSKTLGHLISLICFLSVGFVFKESFLNGRMNFLVSVLWFLSMMNAINLIDVMDGLSSSVSISAAASFLALAVYQGNFVAAVYMASLIGAIFAFFLYNRPPAKIYMGDAGSLFIGGILATFPFFISWSEINNWGFAIPLIILFVPLYEITALVLIRTCKGIPFFRGSRDHFSLIMFDRGMSKVKVLTLTAVFSSVAALLGFVATTVQISPILATIFFIGYLAVWMIVVYKLK